MIKIKKILKTKAVKIMAITFVLTGMLGMMVFGNFVQIDNTYKLGETVKNSSGVVVSYNESRYSRLELTGSTPFASLRLSHKVYPAYSNTAIASGPAITFGNNVSYAQYNSSGSASLYLETTYDKYCQYTTWGFKGTWHYSYSK